MLPLPEWISLRQEKIRDFSFRRDSFFSFKKRILTSTWIERGDELSGGEAVLMK